MSEKPNKNIPETFTVKCVRCGGSDIANPIHRQELCEIKPKEPIMIPMKYHIEGMRAFIQAQIEECPPNKEDYWKKELENFNQIHPIKEKEKE